MCDFVHVLLVDRLERRVLADRQAAIVRGADQYPSVPAEVELFEAALNAEPEPMSPIDFEQYELNRVLGVA